MGSVNAKIYKKFTKEEVKQNLKHVLLKDYLCGCYLNKANDQSDSSICIHQQEVLHKD